MTSAGASGASYHALDLGAGFGGGMVECGTNRALWLPYVEVRNAAAETDRALRLGAHVMLEPREGPFGWRSVVRSRPGTCSSWSRGHRLGHPVRDGLG